MTLSGFLLLAANIAFLLYLFRIPAVDRLLRAIGFKNIR